MIKVLDPGLNTTIQDMGRHGHYHLGVPPSGAADKYCYQLGNILLGNPIHFPALEMTLLGPKVEFQKNTVIALTGAPMEAFINDTKVPMWECLEVKAGDILSFKYTPKGVRTYLCVSGGITEPATLGSTSTYSLNRFGVYLGKKLDTGTEINIGEPLPGAFRHVGRRIPDSFIPDFKDTIDVRLVVGMSSYRLADEGVQSFLNSEWKVSAESNRIAYRFTGANITFKDFDPPFGAGSGSSNTVDIAYPIGVVMAPNCEEIIILLNDATTGGGFVTIGTVISPDLDLVSQTRPNTITRFIAVTVDQAIQARMEKKRKIMEVADLLKSNI